VGADLVPEAPALVAGLDDVTVVGEAIQQGRGRLCLDKNFGLFVECRVGGNNHQDAPVETVDQMEQQLASGLGEGRIVEFVEDDDV
jgi:hypothetical protein